MTIPKAAPGNSLTVRTLIQGSGTTLTKSEALAANFVLYFWQGKSSSLKANTFTSSPTVIGGTMLPGLESALIGKKVGSRILAVIPPSQGYGTSGNSQLAVAPGYIPAMSFSTRSSTDRNGSLHSTVR